MHRLDQPVFLLSLLAALAVLATPGNAEATGARLTYLANEGFLIEGGGKKVLVDALHHGGVEGYPALEPETQRRLEAAEAPFADVDLVLASHHHADHFEPVAVGRHLLANPKAHFVSTEQAVEQLRTGFDDFSKIENRVHGAWPGEGETVEISVGGLDLTVLNLHHGRDRKPPVQNLGLLFSVGGTTFLHVGDTQVTARDVAAYELSRKDVDVLLLPYWHLLGPEGRKLRDAIDPGRVVAMHLPSEDAPAGWFGRAGTLEGLREQLRALPGVDVPVEPGKKIRFDKE